MAGFGTEANKADGLLEELLSASNTQTLLSALRHSRDVSLMQGLSSKR